MATPRCIDRKGQIRKDHDWNGCECRHCGQTRPHEWQRTGGRSAAFDSAMEGVIYTYGTTSIETASYYTCKHCNAVDNSEVEQLEGHPWFQHWLDE